MISNAVFRQMALTFPGTIELPHFDRVSFRVNKKIFATLVEKDHLAMLKLPLIEQSVFCTFDNKIIYPVPGGWGRKGATYIDLKRIKKAMLKDAMTVAYNNIPLKGRREK